MAIAYDTKNYDTVYCKYTVSSVFLSVGEIYTSYSVSVKLRKYPRTYGKNRNINVVKQAHGIFCVFLTHAYCTRIKKHGERK